MINIVLCQVFCLIEQEFPCLFELCLCVAIEEPVADMAYGGTFLSHSWIPYADLQLVLFYSMQVRQAFVFTSLQTHFCIDENQLLFSETEVSCVFTGRELQFVQVFVECEFLVFRLNVLLPSMISASSVTCLCELSLTVLGSTILIFLWRATFSSL